MYGKPVVPDLRHIRLTLPVLRLMRRIQPEGRGTGQVRLALWAAGWTLTVVELGRLDFGQSVETIDQAAHRPRPIDPD